MQDQTQSPPLSPELFPSQDGLDFDFDSVFQQSSGWFEPTQLDVLREQLEHLSDISVKAIQRQTHKILNRLSKEKQIMLRDKISFVFGASYLWTTGFVFGRFPHLIPIYYLLTTGPLIVVRYFLYRKKSWHYFLADLCYFTNFLTVLLLFVFPDNQVLYNAVFGLANGPVAWAIYAWRNALVFHSLDKMTSIIIHIAPAIALYCVRWFPGSPDAYYGDMFSYKSLSFPSQSFSFVSSIVIPVLFYIIWQAAYCYFIIERNSEKFFSGKRVSSYSWMLQDFLTNKQSSYLSKLANKVGKQNHLYFFMTMNAIYAFLTLLPVWLFFNFFWIHTGFIVFIINLSVFNGADYYMEVFSRRYVKQVQHWVEEQEVKLPPAATEKESPLEAALKYE
ncbi:hypothetical protein EDD86DRAFT_214822 [Gorgonomyces haynaldii]|nr:hypothetical protein EDD86DRAFT_214822 [Gorgonomyces haynaldii]